MFIEPHGNAITNLEKCCPIALTVPIETLDQAVAQKVNLRVTCKLCARTRVIPAAPLEGLARLRRWPVSLIPLSCKLRCGTCGGKSVELKATADPTDGPAIGPTTEREWQALVRRLRD